MKKLLFLFFLLSFFILACDSVTHDQSDVLSVAKGSHDFRPDPSPTSFKALDLKGYADFPKKNKNAIMMGWRPCLVQQDVIQLCVCKNIDWANVPEKTIYTLPVAIHCRFKFDKTGGRYTIRLKHGGPNEFALKTGSNNYILGVQPTLSSTSTSGKLALGLEATAKRRKRWR